MEVYFEYLRVMVNQVWNDIGRFFYRGFSGWSDIPYNFQTYNDILRAYSPYFGFWGWFFWVLFLVLLIVLIVTIIRLIIALIRRLLGIQPKKKTKNS